MHLSQISASPKVTDDLADHGRAARQASKGEGFQSVFAGDASAGRAAPTGSGARDSDRAASSGHTGDARARGAAASSSGGNGTAPPGSRDGARLQEENAGNDDQGAGAIGAQQPTDDLSETAAPDGWVLPGFAPVLPASGGANSVQAYNGSVQGELPPETPSEPGKGAVAQMPGAVAGAAAGSYNTATPAEALSVAGPGEEKPAQSMTPVAADVAGKTSHGVSPAGLQASMAGLGREAGVMSVDGQGPVNGFPGGAGSSAADLPASAAPPRTEGGAGAATITGESADAVQVPTGSRELPRDGRETRVAAGSTSEMAATAMQGGTKGETSSMTSAASVAGGVAPNTDFAAQVLGSGSGVGGSGEGLFGADQSMTDPLLGDARSTLRSPAAGTLPVLQSPDTPRQVALQVAEVIRASGERAVELKLQPEELGRVHLTMSQDATGTLTVSLNAERAETLDLLRRNIDLLGADLQELGYESINFSFQGDGAEAQQDTRPGWSGSAGAAGGEAETQSGNLPQAGAGRAHGSGDGIDIRI